MKSGIIMRIQKTLYRLGAEIRFLGLIYGG
jgi:hypothetical protein